MVFILGESTNRNHMHLYGYYLPNTPNLDDMANRGEISVFRDVVSHQPLHREHGIPQHINMETEKHYCID